MFWGILLKFDAFVLLCFASCQNLSNEGEKLHALPQVRVLLPFLGDMLVIPLIFCAHFFD